MQGNLTLNLSSPDDVLYENAGDIEDWLITLADTGVESMTGARIAQLKDYLNGPEFMVTYGDGVSNVDITSLIEFHNSHGKEATLTAVRPPGRYGALNITNNMVTNFQEKPEGDGSWINGGYFVLSPKVIDRIKNYASSWEAEPLEELAKEGELVSFEHCGFWQPMDTLRDKNFLEELWTSGKAPWKIW